MVDYTLRDDGVAKGQTRQPDLERIRSAVEQAGALVLPKPEIVIPVPATDLWQIVVIGAIDTRQHSPQWYRIIEAITDNELKSAMTTLAGVIFPVLPTSMTLGVPPPPAFGQFDVGPFAISVVPDKWTVNVQSVFCHSN